MHWVEWNEKTLHLLDPLSFQRKTATFGSNFSTPFYCRTVLLPYFRIFLCGGRKGSGLPGLKESYIISLEDQYSVVQLPDMVEGRSNHLVLYCKDSIFVIGGCDSSNFYTKSCEKFDLREEKWEKIAELNEKKDTVGGCAASHLNCLYVFGGRNGPIINTVEKYDIRENLWYLTSMQMPYDSALHGVCLIPCQDRFIVFAGQQADGKPHSLFCEAKIGENRIVDLGNMETKGNCIVDHPVLIGGKILSFVFEGFSSRSLAGFDCGTYLWSDLDTII